MRLGKYMAIAAIAFGFATIGCEDSGSDSNGGYQLSSNWNLNAQQRIMNIASPHMPDDVAATYISWTKSRGSNTAHVILANKGDGEYSGYSIYGPEWDWEIDEEYVAHIKKRIKQTGLRNVLWLLTDDSDAFNAQALSDPARYVNDLHALGFLDGIAGVCLGLEMTEYMTEPQVAALAAAARAVYSGDVGTHHNSGRMDFAAYGDTLYYQTAPGLGVAEIREHTAKALTTGKRIVYFELAHNPARELCQAAIDAGADGAGNW